jgi:hypothetical protein
VADEEYLRGKTRNLVYVPRWEAASRSHLSLVHINCELARGDMAVIDTVLMNSANPVTGTPLGRAASSQVFQASWVSLMEGAGWVSVQGLKLEARDRMFEESLTLIAIFKEEGELEEESEGGGWWRDWSSRTMLLVATTSSTCERVTREGSGFRGAKCYCDLWVQRWSV